MFMAIYSIFHHKVEFEEEHHGTGIGWNIDRLNAECQGRNPQYIDEATGKAFDRGPWLFYQGEKPFDWDIVDHKPTDLEKASAIRAQRNGLLAASDWTKDPSGKLPNASEWKTYRQALLDITKQPTFPGSVEWPEAPSA